jgi:RNA polymerase sigma-70 factor, ECF subfamily
MAEKAQFESQALPHMESAFNLAFHLLRGRADAEDAVQDAYVRAFRAFHQLEGEIKPWLLSIVRNVCYRRLQERRRLGNVISLDEALGPRSDTNRASGTGGMEFATKDPTPEQAAINASEQLLLTQAIGKLAPVFREVIVLRELEELSYREIADIIGAPVGTVMSRLSRARSELRHVLTGVMNQTVKDDRNAR